MSDLFHDFSPGLESPPSRLFAVSPDDAADLLIYSRAISVAESGTVQVTTLGGDIGTLFISAGAPFPIRARRVWATGTTATGIIALC